MIEFKAKEIHERKVEDLARAIESKNKEQGMKYRLAVEELRRRKVELTRELYAQTRIVGPEHERHYVVLLPRELGSAHIEVGWTGSYLVIRNLQIGSRLLKNSALRHLGIGRLLIGKIIGFAREKGLEEIQAYSAADSYDFYKKMGFKQHRNSNYFTMDL
ncbi:MAG: hypothetical protein COT55_01095 [Candidatus Diapherotrites archaeon CG09_land_8_20_14_0_10_32_12]|nr:MAG: hypothetical protein COT55_01095 [Candidatus Diapherotrites archaeon CG09_land_8_20_14_0_10_32_12]